MGGAYAGWRGHVIVCGLHGVGLRIVELLNSSNVPTVVIDDHPDPRLARTLTGWGIPHIAGSSSAETLAEAGLAGAFRTSRAVPGRPRSWPRPDWPGPRR